MTKGIQVTRPLREPCSETLLSGIIELLAKECLQCGACMKECRFLQEHGEPGKIAMQYLAGDPKPLLSSFSCSLCRLCTHTCPKQLPVADMFLELRRRSVRKDRRILKAYKPLRLYEALGGSSALKGYFLPEGCHAVYFPGCALPGIRPEQTEKLFRYLQNKIPQLGLVLDCCSKPSHDLGDHEGFVEKNTRQLKRLKEAGVRQIITSCSSCLRVFRQYAPEIDISMAYTHLSELVQDPDSLQRPQEISTRNYTVHDPCTVRFDAALQKSIRQLISLVGGSVIDMDHSGARTLCCGEGGAVGFVANEKKQSWQKKRKDEAGSLEMVTYCAGCTISLSSHATWHILDLVFPAKNGNRPRLVKPPMTYINRYLFKRKMVRYFTQSAMTAIPATYSSEKRHHKS